MLTVRWNLFRNRRPESKFNACSFDELPFVCSGEEAYTIKVPCLTLKEMRHLNAQLPEREGTSLDIPDVPPEDVEAYAKLYRYFPYIRRSDFYVTVSEGDVRTTSRQQSLPIWRAYEIKAHLFRQA